MKILYVLGLLLPQVVTADDLLDDGFSALSSYIR